MQTINLHDTTIHLLPIPEGAQGTRRSREREAVLEILRRAFGEDAELLHDPSGAPRVQGTCVRPEQHISVSHSSSTAAVAIRRGGEVGVDIEQWREQLVRVASRFLSPAERDLFCTPDLLLKAWTSKEAVFKAAGVPDLIIADVTLSSDLSHASIPEANDERHRRFRLFHHTPAAEVCLTIAIPDE